MKTGTLTITGIRNNGLELQRPDGERVRLGGLVPPGLKVGDALDIALSRVIEGVTETSMLAGPLVALIEPDEFTTIEDGLARREVPKEAERTLVVVSSASEVLVSGVVGMSGFEKVHGGRNAEGKYADVEGIVLEDGRRVVITQYPNHPFYYDNGKPTDALPILSAEQSFVMAPKTEAPKE